MYIATIFDPTSSTAPSFNTFTYSGCKVLIINESVLNITITWFGNSTYVPANDRRFLDFTNVPSGVVNWSITSNTGLQNTFNRIVIEIYQPDEDIIEVYPSPLLRSVLGIQ